MRIGIDARPLNVGRGGIWRYTRALIDALATLGGHEVVLYGHPVASALPEGVRWSRLWFPGKRWLDQLHLLGSAREIDVFHGTNYYIPLHASIPRVLTVHDLSVQMHPETHPRVRRLHHRLLPARCRRAQRIVVDSASVREELLRWLQVPPERVEVVPLAAEERFRPAPSAAREAVRERLGLPPHFVLYVGALEPRKNLPALLRAMASLRAAGEAPPLVLAGTGAPRYEAELRALADELGLAGGRDLFLPGFVAEEDLPALFSACTLTVYPSLYEGFGLPPLEAMACGAPVVVLGAAALVEHYGDAALVTDTAGLAEAIRRVLHDGALRAELVARGARRAGARRWTDVAREMLRIYDEAVGAAA